MDNGMELLCRMWKFSAIEYMEFLERHGINCFGISVLFGENVAIYANEEKYLQISVEDEKFNRNEKQLLDLLELMEKMVQESVTLSKDSDDKVLDEKQLVDEDDEYE